MKNIIIFGNGLVSKDLNLAHRVDNTDEFDLVIRMNECKILPFHDRIGWRTDVYTFCARQTMVDMHGMCKEIWWWQNQKQMELLLYPPRLQQAYLLKNFLIYLTFSFNFIDL